MTISEVEREVAYLVLKYNAYGVDVILKVIAYASIEEPNITEDYVQALVKNVTRDELVSFISKLY